jgi:Dirigent-like protein
MNLTGPRSIAIGTAIALTTAITLGVAISGPSAAGSGATEFTLNLRNVSEHGIDHEPKGGGPGAADQIVFHKKLTDGAEAVGHVDGLATAVTGGRNPRILVEAVVTIRGGTLTVAETFRLNSDRHDIAITGGTGAYQGASGSLTSGLPGQDNDDVLFRILLP